MKAFLYLSMILPALSASAGTLSLGEACRKLCEHTEGCLRRCVGHSELMELRSELVLAAAGFHKDPELRLTALRTGANLESFEICRTTGWSTDNQLICLRSYPTPELIKSCKKLSTLEEEQVRCVRNGRSAAAVDACSGLLVGGDQRIACVELRLSVGQTTACKQTGNGSRERLACLQSTKALGARSPASE